MQSFAQACKDWDEWDKPAEPFLIHGNTWYVGTCGISAILIEGDDGLVLIDTGTAKGSEVVAANIASLGFKITDVKALLGGHGISIMSAAWRGSSRRAVRRCCRRGRGRRHPHRERRSARSAGRAARSMEPVTGAIRAVADGEQVAIAGVQITGIATPGHTIGAMSWQWESCKDGACITIVYADSLSPVSADEYRFTDHPDYVAMFRGGIAHWRGLNAMLLTPHPSASGMISRCRGSFESGISCRGYASAAGKRQAIGRGSRRQVTS